ncbi:hypothetical protein [Streptomyces ipomoeae]|uniref:hypothetical protein n=1 Tax=Streptomyces ipomoeae TaxID=103232 RepID=UPI0029BE6540|nr:hypothetical protein [Streptomyces ipomoeae]MDX2696035.1 hypothetical protein [Streptomyces ipomoeae]
MTTTVCPNNPPGHDWDNGLTCRWCDATRTPGEAIISGLASRRGGSDDAARKLLEAYRVAVLTKAGVEYEDCPVCGAAQAVGRPCNTCAFRARIAAEAGEKATTVAATATPFFQPGRTYTRTTHRGARRRFTCEHLTTDPQTEQREAWGWLHRTDGTRRMERMWDDDYPKWAPVDGGDGRD